MKTGKVITLQKTFFSVVGAIFVSLGTDMLKAETTYYLNNSEGGGDNKSWTTPGNWTTFATNSLSGALAAGGVPATEFSSDDGFVVPCYVTLRTPGGTSASYQWSGKYLQLGGLKFRKNYETATLRQEVRGVNSSVSYLNNGLILGVSAQYMPYYSSNPYHVYGNITVTADNAKYPAEFRQRGIAYNVSLYLHDKFRSDPGTYARINSATNGFQVFLSDTTEYYGHLALTNAIDVANLKLQLETDFPGTLVVSTNVTLKTAADGNIANLELQEGAIVDVSVGPLVVTNSFAHAGKVRVVLAAMPDEIFPASQAALSVPGEFSADDFEFVLSDGTPFHCDRYDVVTDGGVTSISCFKYGIVKLTQTDSALRTSTQSSAMTNGMQWTDGLWPTNPTVNYVVTRVNNAATYLRTYDTGTISEPVDDFVFGGNSLTIDNAYLMMLNKSFRSNKLVLRNGGRIYTPNSSASGSLLGPVVAETGTATFNAYSDYKLTIKGEISGTGKLVFTGPDGGATSAAYATYILEGINTNFTGTTTVTLPAYKPSDMVANTNKITPRFDRNYIKLFLTDKRNLGGPLDAMNPKAFTIENMSRVAPTNVANLVLDDATRGIFIKWVGRFYADLEQTISIASPIAVYGTMWKEGAGTLVLANLAPTFGADATASTPDADATNRMFRIAGGSVKIASVDAVNGLDVVLVGAASRLALDLSVDDIDLKLYGIRNTKTDSPFAVADGAEGITVLLDADEPPPTRTTRGIFTVKNSAYSDVAALVKFEKSETLTGWSLVRKTPRDNGDGTTTMVVTVRPSGFSFSFK